MRIAIDVMGGDLAPDAAVQGALAAAEAWPDVQLTLVGDKTRIQQATPQNLQAVADLVEIVHTTEVITAEDEPARAVRRKQQASMCIAARMVKDGKADAMISAGNTGALLAVGLLIIGRLPGIERPALAPMIPTADGVGVLALDLGANMDATPEQLVQYALMGSLVRRKVENMHKPRVGLLNVGTEEQKGNTLTKATFPLLRQAPIHFVGNVEARDVLNRACDVLICDGFVGNVMLKAVEGAAQVLFSQVKEVAKSSWMSKLAGAVLQPKLRRMKLKFDYVSYGGAQLLGVQGICVKAHGSSDRHAFKNAVKQADMILQQNILGCIAQEIGQSGGKA